MIVDEVSRFLFRFEKGNGTTQIEVHSNPDPIILQIGKVFGNPTMEGHSMDRMINK